MAMCGWCKTKNLTPIKEGLEPHDLPNTRKKCEGILTSPYRGGATTKRPQENK